MDLGKREIEFLRDLVGRPATPLTMVGNILDTDSSAFYTGLTTTHVGTLVDILNHDAIIAPSSSVLNRFSKRGSIERMFRRPLVDIGEPWHMATTEEEENVEDTTSADESSELEDDEELEDEDEDDDDDDESDEDESFAGTHPIGQILDEWIEWVSEEANGELEVEYDEEEDVFNVERNGRTAVVYTSDIDEDFYGDSQALFVESEIGAPPENLDLSQTLKFSGNELVLSRISLTDRHSKSILLVEAAIPLKNVVSRNFDLMVREVATIGRDLRKHLGGVLEDDDDDD